MRTSSCRFVVVRVRLVNNARSFLLGLPKTALNHLCPRGAACTCSARQLDRQWSRRNTSSSLCFLFAASCGAPESTE